VPEIYELGLTGCELAILSACRTNSGPQQRGEGTWALSRGSLVCGARRVVASDWLVDDEAAAGLIGVYSTLLAKAQKEGKPADDAGALRDAKRWVRTQDKWKAPYYRASLVPVGPP
jgi:CHAT domain-containing protein